MDRAKALIPELTRSLVPVRRVPPLRRLVLGVMLLWAGMGAAAAFWPGVRAMGNPGFLPIFAALVLAASGASLAALAQCVPGRAASARLGFGLCAAGAMAIGALAWHEGFPPASGAYLREGFRHDGTCIGLAIALALPIWATILWFGRHAFVLRPAPVALLTSVAGGSAGAALVHTLCPEGCAEHALGAHGMAPLWGVLVLTVPALWMLRRARSR